MIRKIKKREYDKYNVDGLNVGDKVLYYDDEYEIVGLDIKNANEVADILLDKITPQPENITIDNYKDSNTSEIVYKKGARKATNSR